MSFLKERIYPSKKPYFFRQDFERLALAKSNDRVESGLSGPWPTVLLAVILLISGTLCYFSLHNGHSWAGDFALYIRQAESLLAGNSDELLAWNAYAMENSVYTEQPIGPHLYPWGFPLLLSPVYAFFGHDIFAMKVYVVLFLLLSLVVVWHLFRERLGEKHTLLLVALLGFNPYLVAFTNVVYSDIPFLFSALLSLLLIQRIREERWVATQAFTYALTGCVIFGAYLIRFNGIVLLPVLLLTQLVGHRAELRATPVGFIRKNPAMLLPYVFFGLGFLLVKALLPVGSSSYLGFFNEFSLGKMLSNLVQYLALPAHFYSRAVSPAGYPVALLLYLLTLPFAVLGVCRHLLRDFHYILYAGLLFALVTVFPIPVYVRLIFSAFPFYLYFTFQGLMEAEAFFRKRGKVRKVTCPAFRWERLAAFAAGNPVQLRPSRFILFFCLIVLSLFVFRSSADAYRNMKRERAKLGGAYSPNSQQMLSFVKNSLPPEAEIIFHEPRVMSLFTQRQALRVTKLAAIEAGKGDFLVYDLKQEGYQVPLKDLEQIKARHPVVFENEDFLVFRLND